MTHRHVLSLLVAVLLPFGAAAQWVWLDKDGSKVFSDRAPSGSIPEKNILKRPNQGSQSLDTTSQPTNSPSSGTAAPDAAGLPKLSGVDKALAERKAKAELAEQKKQQAAEAKIAAAKADNCARAKFSKATVDSGLRLSRVNSKGEREIMDDAARAAEAKRLQEIIAADCK